MPEKIYRFVSFSEAYRLLRQKQLKITKMALMQDKNEGLAAVYQSLASPFGSMFRKHEAFIEGHRCVIENSYVSCWTKEPNNIAMWLLYSPHMQSIRVSTTVDKLSKATTTWGADNYWTKHLHSPQGTFQLHNSRGEVEDVKYIEYLRVVREIKNRYDDYCRKLSEGSTTQGFEKAGEQFFQNDYSISGANPLLLKDHAYKHEKEVRAIFWGGIRNDLSYDEWKKIVESENPPMSYVFGTATLEKASVGYLPPVKYIEVDDFMIEEICFDPRMPEHEKSIYIEALGLKESDPRIVTSGAFGYIPDAHSFDFEEL